MAGHTPLQEQGQERALQGKLGATVGGLHSN